MKTETELKIFLEWIKNNAILLIWSLLVFSAIFNFGYFVATDIKYINYLTIGDYYAGTMVNMLFMFLVVIGLLVTFNFETKNIWYKSVRSILRSLMFFCRGVYYMVILMYYDVSIARIANKTEPFYGDNKKIQCIHARCKKLRQKVKNIKGRIVKHIISLGKNLVSLLVFLGVLFVLTSAIFFCLYLFSGKLSCFLLLMLFNSFIVLDSFIQKNQTRRRLFVFGVLLLAASLGNAMFNHDIKAQKLTVCLGDECYFLIRKIENGYFVTSGANFLFLDSDSIIKTEQVQK